MSLVAQATAFRKLAQGHYRLAPTSAGPLGWALKEIEHLGGDRAAEAAIREVDSLDQDLPPPSHDLPWEKRDDRHKARNAHLVRSLDKALVALKAKRKRHMRAKEYEDARATKEAAALFLRARWGLIPYTERPSSADWKEQRAIQRLPKQQRSAPGPYLYHATNPTDAFGILQAGAIHATPTYNRVPLTADPTAAAKFGSVVFAFDAKQLQRKGVRKMKYLSDKQRSGMGIDMAAEDDPKNPVISDIYSYEQEWVAKAPLSLKYLRKVLVYPFRNDPQAAPEVAEALREVAQVPVQVTGLPSYSEHSPGGFHERDEFKFRAGRGLLFSHVVEPFLRFRARAREFVNQRVQEKSAEWGETPEHYRQHCLAHDRVFQRLSRLSQQLREITQYASGNRALRLGDLKTLRSAFEYLTAAYDDLPSELEAVAAPVKEIVDALPEVEEAFAQAVHSSDAEYEDSMRLGSPFPERVAAWVRKNPERLVGALREIDADHTTRYELPEKERRALGKLENALHAAEPDSIPLDIWTRFPLELLDHPKAHTVSPDTLIQVLRPSKYDADWITQYRWGYAEGEKREHLEQVIRGLGGEIPEEEVA